MDDKIDLLAEMDAEEAQVVSETKNEKPAQRSVSKLKLAVLGDRDKTVGIRTLFEQPEVEVRNFERVDDLVVWDPNLSFICCETKLLSNDTLEDSEVIDAVSKILLQTKGGICLKSNISPETVQRIYSSCRPDDIEKRFVYNPAIGDIYAVEDTLYPELVILGGSKEAADALISIYSNMSNMVFREKSVVYCSAFDASFFKLAVSGYKAVVQTFFNQLHDVAGEYDGVNMNQIRSMFLDARVMENSRLLSVPTFVRCKESENLSYKRARAYKGEYLNEDVRLFAGMSDKLPLIDECVNYKNLKDA